MNTTTNEISTCVKIIEEDYSPPVTIKLEKDGRVKYVPIQWEKDLVMYDLTLSQTIYPDGSLAHLYVNIKIDFSKNIIKSRFEILDL